MEIVRNSIDSFRPFLESLYFISTVLIAFASIYAMKQVKLLKKSISINSKRDSLKLTSEQCRLYMDKIIPLQDKRDHIIQEKNIKYYDGWQINLDGRTITISRDTPPIPDNKDILVEDIAVLNAMESFSIYFVSKVADEYVAYNAVGATFLYSVGKLIPTILLAYRHGHYKHIIKLYMIWESRNRVGILNRSKHAIEEKLSECIQDIVYPLGVDVSDT